MSEKEKIAILTDAYEQLSRVATVAEEPFLKVRLSYVTAQICDLLSHLDPWHCMVNPVEKER
ncbi:MAG: hypothetical protein ACRERD_23725 [Candidatus Binatia bacterium]